jgi:glycosyltransferase involved in cell wall biosynthesis
VTGPTPRLACFATQGTGHRDEARIRALLHDLDPTVMPFDHAARGRSALNTWRHLRRTRTDLVVMEGTGIGGGLACLLAGRPYIVSTGDAVGPFWSQHGRLLGLLGALYERVLLSRSAGVIGWSPYLAGRAITLGAPRAMTAPGWATPGASRPGRATPGQLAEVRDRYGIARDAIVVGLVGSIEWSGRRGYAYGLELVRAMRAVRRADVVALVVGDGSGLDRLRTEAGDLLGRRVILPGRIPAEEVELHLRAMDLVSLPQSTDALGALRYTTKLPEYLAAGRPVVTGELPLAYDLDSGWLWRLPGDAPWEPIYVAALAALLDGLDPAAIAAKAERVPTRPTIFDRRRQQDAAAAFVRATLARQRQ